MKVYLKKHKKSYDSQFLLLAVIFTVLGLVAIADASAPLAERNFADKFFFVKQQGIWALIGVSLLFITTKIHFRFWEKIATPLFFANILLMLLVFVPGVGVVLLGAKRWIFIGALSIQPSEFLKLTLAIYIAKLSSRNKRLLSYFVPIVVSAGLVMLQPDLGTTVLIVGIAMTQLFVSGINLSTLFFSSAVGGLLALLSVLISPYRRERLLTYFEQTKDPLGSAYHIRQILLALGSGGFFGVGLGASRQKYLFLPETAGDSIFAVIAEEAGFLGAGILLALFTYFIFKGIGIVKAAPDKFSQVLAAGLIGWIGGQIFLNIGSMVALVPLTGVPLPFISYGGSSLIAILVACGILLSISKHGNLGKN